MRILNLFRSKIHIILLIVLVSIVLLIPLFIIGFSDNGQPIVSDNCSFVIKDKNNDQITVLDEKDFIFGTVAVEMPVTFESEALKAQTVAAYTFYKRQQTENKNLGYDYDFLCDISSLYKSDDELKTIWAEKYTEYHNKLLSCVDAVFGEMLTKNNKPIVAVFHAVSSGMTESGADIFGGNTDYLLPVISPGDLFAPDYNTVVTISFEDFKSKVCSSFTDITLGDNPEEWITDIRKSNSGSVLSLCLGSIIITGTQLRNCLSLRSANFDVSINNGSFVFSVKGYGHGVGMSQYGAEYLALQGSTYREILYHYYPNTTLE